MKKKKAETSGSFQTVLIFLYLLTWKPSLFLRWRLLSLRRVFCFSSSSSFSRALMCSSKQMRASSLSISIITGQKKKTIKTLERSTGHVQEHIRTQLWKYFILLKLKPLKMSFHTLQLFILCKGRIVQQVLLSLRPGGPVCHISHVIQYVFESFPVPLS